VTQRPLKLQLGCGPGAVPAGWINLDGSWNALLAKYPLARRIIKTLQLLPAGLADVPWSSDVVFHDLRRPLPFPDQSFAAVYGSHILEHLYLDQARRLLAECLRVLQPGGVLRMVVPDVYALAEEYVREGKINGQVKEQGEKLWADRLNERLGFRSPSAPSGNAIFRVYSAWNDFHSHKWMYDSQSLLFYFQSAGFTQTNVMDYLQSGIHGIEEVELADRLLHGNGVCVEGQKPIA
jgi:SAM-dependent methyltransferase